MKKKTIVIIGLVVLVIAILAIVIGLRGNQKELVVSTKPISEGSLEVTVMATGYIQPVEEIEVGTQVSGVIEEIYVDFNSHVTTGQLLAVLDKSTLEEKRLQAESSVSSSKSEYSHAELNYSRVKRLHDGKAATDADLETALNSLNQAKSSLTRAEADLRQAKVNLSYAYIKSPVDGVVLDRSVNKGQTVAASFNTPTLFTIAEDLTKMQVEADVDEADIGQIELGQQVTFSVDAYYGEVFSGTVSQIRLQPITTNNVVTYTVIIDAPNPEKKLFPGMTANITITIESEKGLLVPVEAINFEMTPEYAENLAVALPATGNPKEMTVWVKKGTSYEQRSIQVGMNDGINMIATSGIALNEEVVLSAGYVKSGNKNEAVSIMPKPPGR